MMRIISLMLVAMLSWMSSLQGQNSLESVLVSIRQNNHQIAAARQQVAALKLESQTGNSPADPFITTDYLIGRPVEGGNQLDITATQAFDFPTVYAKKRQLADQKGLIYDLHLRAVEQDVLWEAKQIGLKLIYLTKRLVQLESRLTDAQSVHDKIGQKLKAGESTILEVNKARIHLLTLQHDFRMLQAKQAEQLTLLSTLNGGIPVQLDGQDYPGPTAVPDLETVNRMVTANDPRLLGLRQHLALDEKEIDVRKAMALPKLEAGYHFQQVLGQTFNGVHVGASLPLWNNKNRVKAAQSQVKFRQLDQTAREFEVSAEIREKYAHQLEIKESLDDFRAALEGLTTQKVLKASLDLQEIDFITYAMEIHYFYQAQDQLLEIEHEYHLLVAEMLKSTL